VSARDNDTVALTVVDRLNTEKRAWSFEVVNHLVLENEVVVLGRLVVDGVTKMAFGSSALSRDGAGSTTSVGTDLKSAANEALARAARLMGVAFVFNQIETPAREDGARQEPVRETPLPENRVTQKQLGAIHGFARRRNIGRTELGALLYQRFDKSELVTLTKREASTLIDELAQANGHAGP
jgi:hypothetical protein